MAVNLYYNKISKPEVYEMRIQNTKCLNKEHSLRSWDIPLYCFNAFEPPKEDNLSTKAKAPVSYHPKNLLHLWVP